MKDKSLAISLLSLAIDVASLELEAASEEKDERAAFTELVALRQCLEEILTGREPSI
jgi:hypothetical protein